MRAAADERTMPHRKHSSSGQRAALTARPAHDERTLRRHLRPRVRGRLVPWAALGVLTPHGLAYDTGLR